MLCLKKICESPNFARPRHCMLRKFHGNQH